MKKLILIIVCLLVALPAIAKDGGDSDKTKIGVIYMLHGGMDQNLAQYMWESSIHQFSFEVSHPVYKMAIWNPDWWPIILHSEESVKFLRKFEFEYERIGGFDPFHGLSDQQLADMKTELDKNTDGFEFEVEFSSWMSGGRPGNYPYPRFLYNGPDDWNGNNKSSVTYCGEGEPDGPWAGCDPERYNTDGPVERLLNKGVTRIIAIDMAVGGIRFYKGYDQVQMAKRAMQDYDNGAGTTVPIMWVNDYGNVMERSYPTAPADWGAYSNYPPDPATFVNPKPLLNGCPNPVVEDPELALMHVEGIEAGLSPAVSDSDTGVLLFNHGLFRRNRRFYDPKINDTTIVNKNIKALLRERHPEMNPDNIIGAYGGIREVNPENEIWERTRPMRGEDLAHSYLHESEQDMPGDEWGYRYWDALEYLKDRGVKHIVVSFPQVVTDSVLTLVEYYNQIGKEIGTKTWLYYDEGDNDTYPGVGHPFADYWGNWVDTDCGGVECCFEMGGCGAGFGPYPPDRQQPIDESRTDMDPSLAYDLSDYGHLGYDPEIGPPDPNAPVQNQYTGTWAMYVTPSDDPKMGQLLAKHVLNAVVNPMVYITNGEIARIQEGQSITWQANVQSGTPGYTYEWFIKKDGDEDWTSAGANSASWTLTPAAGEAGTYDVRCVVTDANAKSGEVTFDGFIITSADGPPAISSGPFLAKGWWPVLPTDSENPFFLKQDEFALWTFSDDYASCPEQCTHSATVSSVPGEATTTVSSVPGEATVVLPMELHVETDPSGEWYAYTTLPVESLPNATTYSLRLTVTDCADQSTQSGEYYFRTAVGEDSPAVIVDGPFAATGTWPVLPRWWLTDEAPVLAQNTNIVWTFMDDYIDCAEVPTHVARFRLDDGSDEQDWVWTKLTVKTDPTGKEYAYAEVPAGSLADGTYWFWFEVIDCEGHRTYSKVYAFKVAQP